MSAQTVWQILDAEGHAAGCPAATRAAAARRPGWTRSRPPRCPAGQRRAAVAALRSRRAAAAVPRHGTTWACPTWSARPGYPSTRALSAWQSIGTLLLAKCARKARVHHVGSLADDAGPGVHPRADRPAQGHPPGHLLLAGPPRLQPANCCPGWSRRCARSGWPPARPGSTATSTPSATTATRRALEKHYVPRRSQRTRAVLTFFAQDHASAEMVYANADITKAEQASRDHRLRRLLAAGHRQPTPACWSSTPSSPPTRSSTSSPAAASAGSPCASAARPNSPAWPPCPPRHGRPSPSPGPAATGGPACTKT